MSKLYSKVKQYYNLGIYTEYHVAQFVKKGAITPEEYELITGSPYEEE